MWKLYAELPHTRNDSLAGQKRQDAVRGKGERVVLVAGSIVWFQVTRGCIRLADGAEDCGGGSPRKQLLAPWNGAAWKKVAWKKRIGLWTSLVLNVLKTNHDPAGTLRSEDSLDSIEIGRK